VAVKIKLMRMGKIRAPYYRIVVADARTKRDGRAIEEIGKYHPTEDPSLIEVNSERVQYWLGVGAQPTEPVAAILKVTGDWQKFKGLPGAEGTLRFAAAKTDKKMVFEAAAKESLAEPKAGATTPRKRAPAKKADAPVADATVAEAPVAEAPVAEAPVAEAPVAEAPVAEVTASPEAGTADESKA
jgi:small subunit ribosomal protein S16